MKHALGKLCFECAYEKILFPQLSAEANMEIAEQSQ